MAAERKAEVTWDGDLAHGKGRFNVGSGALPESEVTWASRTERSEGKTSPEELIAAAHASCFSMALSHGLAQAGTPPERLSVSAVCSLDKANGGFKITSMDIDVRGRVPGIETDAFRQAAEEAKEVPFGGAGESGIGARHGAQGIQKYCRTQSILITRFAPKREPHYFPYSRLGTKALERLTVLLYGRKRKRR